MSVSAAGQSERDGDERSTPVQLVAGPGDFPLGPTIRCVADAFQEASLGTEMPQQTFRQVQQPHILYPKVEALGTAMNIEIHDTALEARFQKQMQATGATSPQEALLHLLETQEEQDRWLLENKAAINAKIRRGIEQLDRGEGIPGDRLDDYLNRLKAQSE